MDAAGERAHLADRGLELGRRVVEQRCGARRRGPRELQAHRQRHEPLLGTVVQIALDPPASPVQSSEPLEEITLVPWGSHDLRLSDFPVLGQPPGPLDKPLAFDFRSDGTTGWTWIGGGWWGPAYPYPRYSPYYYYPYAAYPYYAPAPTVIAEQPALSDPGQGEENYWYYCENPQGYYPYVKSCPGGWMRVVPDPPPPNQ